MGKSVKISNVPNAPAFSASGTSSTTVAPSGTKLQFATEDFDTNGNYDTSTHRFTPTVAGYYQVSASVQYDAPSIPGALCTIYKNGTAHRLSNYRADAGNYPVANVSALVYMNGSTDYLEVYGSHSNGSSVGTYASSLSNFFQACLVRPA